MKIGKVKFLYSIPWNIFLIMTGAIVISIGIKAIVIPHGFITGGLTGLSLLLYYFLNFLSPGFWYLIINIPIFIAGWLFVSRRFLLYSIVGMISLSTAIDLISFTIPVQDSILAVLAGGTIIGAGSGIILHSLGSAGGTDIIAIILNKKFGVRIGAFSFTFNLALFGFSFGVLEIDMVLYSLALSFVTAMVLDYFLGIFNQRKMVMIISEKSDLIAAGVTQKLNRGATLLDGKGAFTGKQKQVIMTVVNNYQLKRLEETVFTIDPDAFMVTENTFNVLGKGFSRRKVY
ncbi:MAG: YitT family protein [Deltaproteobacteria bacterium]|nr:YitT family protein [Deltaproteobacteria bacterium]